MMNELSQEKWDYEIKPKSRLFELNLHDVWHHRDLILMFVKRDFTSVYKQTLLGPLWFFIQPLLTTIIFTIVFGRIAKIPTDGIPPTLFYLAGITIWNYFSDCLQGTSDTFIKNAAIFGKVYFPRLTTPISIVISNLFKFGVQMVLFLSFYFYYISKSAPIHANTALFLLPLLVLDMALIGLGAGMIISALTTKYRDLRFLVAFGVQLLMYATTVIYPLSAIPLKYRWLVELNPMTSIIETFKYGFLGAGTFSASSLVLSGAVSVVIFLLGVLTFNKVEKTFMDTV
jgi:lipopolysaccharide transport system permease protein